MRQREPAQPAVRAESKAGVLLTTADHLATTDLGKFEGHQPAGSSHGSLRGRTREWDGLIWRAVPPLATSINDEQATATDGSRSTLWSAALLGQSAGLLVGLVLIIWALADWPNRVYAFGAGVGVMSVSIQQIVADVRGNRWRK